ncbi:MAG TPA: DinB family protein [Candidatus Aquilonibacter sp.]|nr:DinB family protein [Candidatus Aquilonibacter sp.]
MPLTISAEKLLDWNDNTTQRWRSFILANPIILTLPCDIRNGKTIADTLQHIVAVELRYAQRLSSLPESPYEEVVKDSIDSIVAAHELAISLVRNLLADPDYDWSVELTFDTISLGRLRASRETVLVHLTLHSIRHYAQLATLVRQNGFRPTWPMDYLFSAAQRA